MRLAIVVSKALIATALITQRSCEFLYEICFPSLRDVIDSRTGRVLTAGQQFHNAITAPPYMRRRVVGERSVERIELFSILLQALENTPTGPRWLIDPLSCNHRMVGLNHGYTGGNLAVNLVGRNLGDPAQGRVLVLFVMK